MRRAARTDRNQGEIVRALERCGCSVVSLAAVGNGVPDLLVGRHGVNLLMEVKDGKQILSKQKLTEDQVVFHANWKGRIFVVKTVDDVIAAINECS